MGAGEEDEGGRDRKRECVLPSLSSIFLLLLPRPLWSSSKGAIFSHPYRLLFTNFPVSGSVCAAALAAGGIAVTVFESGRGAGGRMSQRRYCSLSWLVFNHVCVCVCVCFFFFHEIWILGLCKIDKGRSWEMGRRWCSITGRRISL